MAKAGANLQTFTLQAITGINADLLSIELLGTNSSELSEISIKIVSVFFSWKCICKCCPPNIGHYIQSQMCWYCV